MAPPITPPPVTLVDYGIGNIFSVTRALEHCGAEVALTADPAAILAAPRLVLPGVGAFSNGMQGLRERGLIEPLRAYAASGRPLLGICLGMQMLFTASSEFGEHEGLGLIEGRIEAIEPYDDDGSRLKVPHIAWNRLVATEAGPAWERSILKYVGEDPHCYFVHSFGAQPVDPAHRLADTLYGRTRISAAVAKGRVYGCQFRPEKSGETGLSVIRAFLEGEA